MMSTTLALLLVGCSSSDETEVQQASVTQNSAPVYVNGQTTLASAKVCLDLNNNASCDEDEPSVTADERGYYTLESLSAISDGTRLIAEDGYNLVLEQNNNGRFRFVALYDAARDENNINTITSLLAQLVGERSYSDEEAQQYLAEHYNIDLDEILQDPVTLATEQKEALWLLVHGIESGYAEAMNDRASRAALRAAAQTNYVTPNLEDTEDFLADERYLSYDVGTYVTRISLKINSFLNEIKYFLIDTLNICMWYCPSGSALPEEILPGIWHVRTQYSQDEVCVEIDAQNNYLEHHTEGNRLYSLYFSEIKNKISIIDGWDVLGSYKIERYEDANSFDLLVGRDTASYSRMETLAACQERIAVGSSIREGVTKVKGKISVDEGVEILSVNYSNNINYTQYLRQDENGSFEYQARDAYEDPWITEWSEKMFIGAVVRANNHQSVFVPFDVDKADILFSEEGHLADVGELEVALTHVKACITDANGERINGHYSYFVDGIPRYRSIPDAYITNGILELDVVKDDRSHALYVIDQYKVSDSNISRVSFTADTASIDLSEHCVSMQEGTRISTEITVQKSYDDNITSLVIYGERGLAVSERVEEGVTHSAFNMSRNGGYFVFVRNNTYDVEMIKGTEVSLNIDGTIYHSKIEHASSKDIQVFRIFYYNGVVSAVYDAYNHRLN